ncbi:MAG TPA: response regulator [Verrucomicrobiae bacterium]|nr:response regulator [Verrucomicrobiae bacterium]
MSQPKNVAVEATVLIVDDHAPMREAIGVCIKRSFPRLCVIEAPDGATALRHVEAHRPSLVLVDIILPDANGLDLTRDIRKLSPATIVAAISIDTSADMPARAIAAGAADCIGKDKLFESLVPLVGAAVSVMNWMNTPESPSP